MERVVFMTNRERKARQRQAYHASMRKPPSKSSTGKSKGIIASPIQRYMAKSGRSYKHPDYVPVMASLGKRHGKTE